MTKKKTSKQQEPAPKVSTTVLGILGITALLLAIVIVGKTVSNRPVSNDGPTIVNISKPELPLSNEVQTKDIQVVGKSLTKLNIDFSRAVFLVGEVNESILQQIAQIQQLSNSSSEPIYLMIDSPGGSVFDGYKMLSAMESSRAPIYTVCMSLCASMAAIIHQYGNQRYMFDRATLMFHDAAGGFQGEMKKMQTRMNYINRALEKVDRKIASKIGISYEKYMSLHQNELWIDAEDSAKMHFADAVIATEYPMMLQTQLAPPGEEKNKKAKVLDVRLITE